MSLLHHLILWFWCTVLQWATAKTACVFCCYVDYELDKHKTVNYRKSSQCMQQRRRWRVKQQKYTNQQHWTMSDTSSTASSSVVHMDVISVSRPTLKGLSLCLVEICKGLEHKTKYLRLVSVLFSKLMFNCTINFTFEFFVYSVWWTKLATRQLFTAR